MNLDGSGLYGALIHSAFTCALFGSALLTFIVLWRHGRLDMDDEAAEQMVHQEEENG